MTELLPDGSYSISDDVVIEGEGASPFVIGPGWLLEAIRLESGEMHFARDGEPVRPATPNFCIFYPPFSIVRMYVRTMRAFMFGIGSSEPAASMPIMPVIFDHDRKLPFTSIEDAVELIDEASTKHSIEMNTRPSLLSLKAKRLIDGNFRVYPSISRIADRLAVSHEHLSRQFKRDYEMTPSAYLHRLRMAEATFKLSMGEEIIDISNEVGYNDLSRFYKQFRKQNKTSPGSCRTALQKHT